MKRLLLLAISALMILSTLSVERCAAQGLNSKDVFNADPTMYVEGGKYYLTGTRNREPIGFGIIESDNLKEWKCANGDSLQLILRKGDSTFGDKGFWAPQIFKEGRYYYMTYSANEQTVLSKSKNLHGPFHQKKVAPIDPSEKNIDSFFFKDEDGTYYLYHVRFNKGNYIWVAEFDMKRGKIKEKTLRRCFGWTDAWERTPNYKSNPVMEGPTVFKKDGLYYMLYSANHFLNIDYAVGYATAPTPYGPWTKSENNPIIHRSIVGENGSGHGDLFTGLDGEYYYIYHVHHSESVAQPRRARIVRLEFTKNANSGIYDIKADANSVIKPVFVE